MPEVTMNIDEIPAGELLLRNEAGDIFKHQFREGMFKKAQLIWDRDINTIINELRGSIVVPYLKEKIDSGEWSHEDYFRGPGWDVDRCLWSKISNTYNTYESTIRNCKKFDIPLFNEEGKPYSQKDLWIAIKNEDSDCLPTTTTKKYQRKSKFQRAVEHIDEIKKLLNDYGKKTSMDYTEKTKVKHLLQTIVDGHERG